MPEAPLARSSAPEIAEAVSGGPCTTSSWYSIGWQGFHRTGSRCPST